jgi:Ni,Fe-hydrogenase III large subunit
MGVLYDPAAGRRRTVHALIFTAVFSRHMFVWLSFAQTLEAVIAGCESAWRFFGGVFTVLVPDNASAIVAQADALNPRFTAGWLEYAQARGFATDPARVRSPRDKPTVERAVQYVRGNCFAGEDFVDLADAQARAEAWCRDTAGQRVHGTTQARPAEVFAEHEAGLLLPVPEVPYVVPIYATVKVHRDFHGHFRFSVVGETILKLKARLWFTHKGIEKLAEGRLLNEVLPIAERISGDTAVGHTLAFCLAVEEARDWPVPPHASTLRAILLELERLYNHVADIGALCNDVGYGIVNAHALRIREELLRLNKQVTGHRLLRGAIVPGGARLRALPDPAQLSAIAADIQQVVDIALQNSVVLDRMTGTAVLSAEQAHDIGTLGYVARASGLRQDARRDHPFTAATTATDIPNHTSGDVLARFLTRADEVRAAVSLINDLLHTCPLTSADTAKPTWLAAGRTSGVGLVEGWRGTIAHRIEMAPDGTVARLKIVDPSFFNWPALPVALTDTIVPDFPLTNKSFNLSYAGNDL